MENCLILCILQKWTKNSLYSGETNRKHILTKRLVRLCFLFVSPEYKEFCVCFCRIQRIKQAFFFGYKQME